MEKSPVLVWQNNGDVRDKSYTYISAINTREGIFELSAQDDTSPLHFTDGHTFYIRGHEQSILFKEDQVEGDHNKVTLPIPEVVRMFEKRIHPRTKLTDQNFPYVYSEVLQGSEERDSRLFQFQLIDISQAGVALRIPLKQQHLFYPGDFLMIKSLGKVALDQAIKVKIVYLKKQYFSDDQEGSPSLRMGLQFENILPQKLLDSVFEKSGIS